VSADLKEKVGLTPLLPQVLCAAVLAIGARVSDHPLLVGHGAPRLIDLSNSAKAGINLTDFGKRREGTCRVLAETAIQLVDEKATLRVASVESIAALMLVEGLLDSELSSLPTPQILADVLSPCPCSLTRRGCESTSLATLRPSDERPR